MERAQLARRTLRLNGMWFAIANVAGGAVVVIYLNYLTPGASGLSQGNGLTSMYVASLYIAVASPIVYWLGARRFQPVTQWLIADRPPTAEERRVALSGPAVNAGLSVLLWVGVLAVFEPLNAFTFHNGAARVLQTSAATILGGLTSSALTFLLVERSNRPLVALALAGEPPARPVGFGVRARLLLAWALGSAIPLLAVAGVLLGRTPAGRGDLAGPIVFLAATGLAAGAVFVAVVAKSVAEPLDAVRGTLRRIQGGDLDVALTVDDASEVGLLQAGVNHMVDGLRERERLHDLFGRHVGVEVARHALEGGTRLGGEVREASALFVDLVGSTTLARRLPPDEVVELLNRFFAAVVRVVDDEGGWVNKFEGDAALCVFGAPADQADHAARALRAARRLAPELDRLGVEAGIGVSSGPVVAGNVGAENRYEYTVIGDPVNEAARLTEVAKRRPGRVAASDAAVARAGAEAERWAAVEQVTLRGRDQATEVHEPVTANLLT